MIRPNWASYTDPCVCCLFYIEVGGPPGLRLRLVRYAPWIDVSRTPSTPDQGTAHVDMKKNKPYENSNSLSVKHATTWSCQTLKTKPDTRRFVLESHMTVPWQWKHFNRLTGSGSIQNKWEDFQLSPGHESCFYRIHNNKTKGLKAPPHGLHFHCACTRLQTSTFPLKHFLLWPKSCMYVHVWKWCIMPFFLYLVKKIRKWTCNRKYISCFFSVFWTKNVQIW